jgi:hypothetical protein
MAKVAAIAGTTRRMSRPASAPMAKAASVQAANATPRRLNSSGSSGVLLPSAKNGWKYQENSRLQPGGRDQRGRQRHQLGHGPAPPAEGLGPRVPEAAALQLPGQYRRPDERPDLRGHHVQQDRDRLRGVAVGVIEVGQQVLARR